MRRFSISLHQSPGLGSGALPGTESMPWKVRCLLVNSKTLTCLTRSCIWISFDTDHFFCLLAETRSKRKKEASSRKPRRSTTMGPSQTLNPLLSLLYPKMFPMVASLTPISSRLKATSPALLFTPSLDPVLSPSLISPSPRPGNPIDSTLQALPKSKLLVSLLPPPLSFTCAAGHFPWGLLLSPYPLRVSFPHNTQNFLIKL